jgi:hypothetical protein
VVIRRYRWRVAGHEFCAFVIPPPQESCLSQLLVFSPLGKRYFTDNLRLNPLDFLRDLWGIFDSWPMRGFRRRIASLSPLSLKPVPE